ncbi:MAG TPA: hypothetical protein VMS98_11260 [Thermoanaerobaculia bacterium]|nr:hypothetical protein [Thermoanaerobaculia bacterium]
MERGSSRSYAGLLNLQADRHWTVFVTDFPLPRSDVKRLREELPPETRPLFVRIDRGLPGIGRELRKAGVDRGRDYVSLQPLLKSFRSIASVHRLFGAFTHVDLARLDLPFAGTRFRTSYVRSLLDVVMRADYGEQERIANRFFELLEERRPYRVTVRTLGEATLLVSDDRPWFDLSGRMHEGESRALPGGEVAYTGDGIDGEFIVDGALLASPQTPRVGRLAAKLGRVSASLQPSPLRLRIARGRVEDAVGNRQLSSTLTRLFRADDRYRNVTEVGISFNRACARFVHDWPAASNEGHPGVHVALGGDPERSDEHQPGGPPLVHLDLMAATAEVTVNATRFLRSSA